MLNLEAKQEIKWWLAHLESFNGKTILTPVPEMVIETDASKQGWGAYYNNTTIGGLWSIEEQQKHINALELMAACLQSSICKRKKQSKHSTKNGQSQLSCLHQSDGGYKIRHPFRFGKEIWQWALSKNINISAVHIAGLTNIRADHASRHWEDPSDWALRKDLFRELLRIFGPFEIDLFANRLNRQLPVYCSWKPDPEAVGTDAFTMDWTQMKRPYLFPPVLPDRQMSGQGTHANDDNVDSNPSMAEPTLVSNNPADVYSQSDSTPTMPESIDVPTGGTHPLTVNNNLQLAAWLVSGDLMAVKAFHKELHPFYYHLGVLEQTSVTIAPGVNGIAGAVNGQLIHFMPLWPLS
ncbi:hypothetical protein FSP39_012543 [Pinctada imbricata]|uniref:Uncharacterized protein n=1 Tax=Pinctada imbricata TaxID=66713 RepID=A0AA88XC64_PINIB|nr:hypothetical protein FSP39_012543 [Pinctada imbricata]